MWALWILSCSYGIWAHLLSRYAWFLAWSSIHFQTSILVFMSCFFFEDLIEIHFQYIPPPKHIGSRFNMYGFRFHSSTSCSVFSIFPCCCTCSWGALFYLIFSSSLPMGTKGSQRHILGRWVFGGYPSVQVTYPPWNEGSESDYWVGALFGTVAMKYKKSLLPQNLTPHGS